MPFKKIILLLPLLFFLFPAQAPAMWTPVNDLVEIDYSEKIIQVYVVLSGKKEYVWGGEAFHTPAAKAARQMIYDYVVNLVLGKGETTLKAELKKRPAMDTKLIILIDKNKRPGDHHAIEESLTRAIYYTFDLKLLLTLFPELNLPEKD